MLQPVMEGNRGMVASKPSNWHVGLLQHLPDTLTAPAVRHHDKTTPARLQPFCSSCSEPRDMTYISALNCAPAQARERANQASHA
jgi:hypothetical protein